LGRPQGTLVEGTVEETIPQLQQKLLPRSSVLVGVGDVTADILVENNFEPDIIITDGQTKRTQLEDWRDYRGFDILKASCPAAEITPDAWQAIREAIRRLPGRSHIKIDGEEDLLVIPLIVELPIESIIVYGQPNKGAVIRIINTESKTSARQLLAKFKEVS
jgi:uncharacterized protein (UPF0218 family)